MKYKFIAFFILFPICLSAQISAIKFDHTDQINTIKSNHDETLIATAGNDGAVNIRDSKTMKILQRIQAGYLPIKDLAINPKWSTVAVLQSDGIDAFYLTVWDYNIGEIIYKYRLQAKPLFIDYSPKGNFLYYSTPQIDGLIILDHISGKRKPWLMNTRTITSIAIMSEDESMLATYVPSGKITIYKIRSGQKIKDVTTNPDLQNPQFVAGGQILLATTKNKIYAIDSKTGKIFNKLKMPGVISISAGKIPGHLVAYCYQDGYTFIYDWNYMKNRSAININPTQDFSDAGAFTYHKNRIYIGHKDGTIESYSPNGDKRKHSINRIIPFTGISVTNKKILLSSKNKILSISLKKLMDPLQKSLLSYESLEIENPLGLNTGICDIGENQVLLYNTKGSKGIILLYNMETKQYKRIFQTETPIVELKKVSNGFLGLDKKGKCFMISSSSLKEIFNYSSFGTKSISLLKDGKMITGRAKDALFNTSMIIVDAQTGETIPILTKDLITFDLCYNENLLSLFTLGIENRNNKIRTVLKRYRANNFQKVETLAAISGENHKATILYDPYTSKIYTTLGTAGINIIQWGGFTTNQKTGHIPHKMAVNKKYLFSLNQDGSVSAWDKKDGKEMITIYRNQSGKWQTVYPSNSILRNKESNLD